MQITVFAYPAETFPSQYGLTDYITWCRCEIERINARQRNGPGASRAELIQGDGDHTGQIAIAILPGERDCVPPRDQSQHAASTEPSDPKVPPSIFNF